MAAKPKAKKTTTVVEEIPATGQNDEEELTELDFSLEEVTNAEKLQEIMEQFPNHGITAKLYDSEGKYCYRLPDPASIDEDVIRKRCGAGDFVIRLYVNGKFRQNIPLPIRQLLSSEEDLKNGRQDAGHSDFYKQLEIQSQRNHELLLAAIGSKAQSAGPSLTDMTTALAALDSLRGKQENTVETLMKGIKLYEALSGKTDWKSDLIQTGKEVLPELAKAFVMGKTGQVPTNGNPMPANGNTPPQLPPEMVIKQGLAFLKKKCLSGVDPELIIDWIVANSEDEQYQILLHAVYSLEFADIAKYDPEIGTGQFLPWFKQLYDGLRSAFKTADPVELDTGGSVGDINNPGNNGKPSAVSGKK